MKNIYQIAGLVVQMDSFGRTEEQALPYRIETEKKADIVISSKWRKLKALYPNISDEDAEYIASGAVFYQHILQYDGMLLHASAVVVNEKAYLFSANPGTGKSTHTGLWLKLFGEKAYILNDDKPALRLVDGKWYAFGTPWSGKNDISVNKGVPVAGICVLEREKHNHIAHFGGKEAIFALFKQTVQSKKAINRLKLLELMDSVISTVPIWKLRCNMELEAAVISFEAMSGQKMEEIV